MIKKRINEGLVGISALVPREWLKKKKATGFSWRQLIARGFNSILDRQEMDKALNDSMNHSIKLNEQNTSLRARMTALEEKLEKYQEKKI